MLRTPEDVTRNFENRRRLVQEIALNQSMVEDYLIKDPATMLNTCSDRLAEAYFELYLEQKDYDEYLDRNYINAPIVPKKKLWQKLLGK